METRLKLFVYGTLRLGGPANRLLKDEALVASDIRLHGYKMYNVGSYPIVTLSSPDHSVVGDLYLVNEKLLYELDGFEGSEYTRITDAQLKYNIYVARIVPDSLEEVADGDWQAYAKKHGIVFNF